MCVVMCCSVLQCVAVCCCVLLCGGRAVRSAAALRYHMCVAVCCNVLQCVAVCCSVLQYVAVGCSALQCRRRSATSAARAQVTHILPKRPIYM